MATVFLLKVYLSGITVDQSLSDLTGLHVVSCLSESSDCTRLGHMTRKNFSSLFYEDDFKKILIRDSVIISQLIGYF